MAINVENTPCESSEANHLASLQVPSVGEGIQTAVCGFGLLWAFAEYHGLDSWQKKRNSNPP